MELRRAPRVQSRTSYLWSTPRGTHTAARRLKLRLFEVFCSSVGGLEVSRVSRQQKSDDNRLCNGKSSSLIGPSWFLKSRLPASFYLYLLALLAALKRRSDTPKQQGCVQLRARHTACAMLYRLEQVGAGCIRCAHPVLALSALPPPMPAV